MLTRRGIIGGLGALLAAPAVVKAASLMPVRGIIMPVGEVPPTLGEWLTLQEYARRFDVEWHRRRVIELLTEANELFDVLPMNQFFVPHGQIASVR